MVSSAEHELGGPPAGAAAEKIDVACTRGGEGHIVAVLDPYNPKGSTRRRQLHHLEALLADRRAAAPGATSATSCSTAAGSSSSRRRSRTTPASWPTPRTRRSASRSPIRDGGSTRRYLPDFLARLDVGCDEPLNLVLEVKGINDESDKAKAQTTREKFWVRPSTRWAASAAGRSRSSGPTGDGRGFRSNWFDRLLTKVAADRPFATDRTKHVDTLKHNEATPAEHSDGADGELLPARGGPQAPRAAEALSAGTAPGRGRAARTAAEPERSGADLERCADHDHRRADAETGGDRRARVGPTPNSSGAARTGKTGPISWSTRRRSTSRRDLPAGDHRRPHARHRPSGAQERADAPDLFADFNGIDPDPRAAFYQHNQHWSNRLILGDQPPSDASLAERESMRGQGPVHLFRPALRDQVQLELAGLDPEPRDVKDGKQADMSREPEQVKAFRDTWKDGSHSYLTCLRDRLTVMRDLWPRAVRSSF